MEADEGVLDEVVEPPPEALDGSSGDRRSGIRARGAEAGLPEIVRAIERREGAIRKAVGAADAELRKLAPLYAAAGFSSAESLRARILSETTVIGPLVHSFGVECGARGTKRLDRPASPEPRGDRRRGRSPASLPSATLAAVGRVRRRIRALDDQVRELVAKVAALVAEIDRRGLAADGGYASTEELLDRALGDRPVLSAALAMAAPPPEPRPEPSSLEGLALDHRAPEPVEPLPDSDLPAVLEAPADDLGALGVSAAPSGAPASQGAPSTPAAAPGKPKRRLAIAVSGLAIALGMSVGLLLGRAPATARAHEVAAAHAGHGESPAPATHDHPAASAAAPNEHASPTAHGQAPAQGAPVAHEAKAEAPAAPGEHGPPAHEAGPSAAAAAGKPEPPVEARAPEDEKATLSPLAVQALVTIAWADGQVSPEESSVLLEVARAHAGPAAIAAVTRPPAARSSATTLKGLSGDVKKLLHQCAYRIARADHVVMPEETSALIRLGDAFGLTESDAPEPAPVEAVAPAKASPAAPPAHHH